MTVNKPIETDRAIDQNRSLDTNMRIDWVRNVKLFPKMGLKYY